MHNNAFILKRYADYLCHKCLNQKVIACVSTSPNDLHILFGNNFYWSIRFYKQDTFFLLPAADHFPKKNFLTPFRSIIGTQVKSVKSYPNDRGIQLNLGKQALHVHCFGRRSGILLTKKNQVTDHFKFTQPPELYEPDSRQVILTSDVESFKQNNAFIPDEMVTDLISQDFFAEVDLPKTWDAYLASLDNRPLYLCKKGEAYKLTLFPSDVVIDTYDDIGKAHHDFGKLYMAHDRFDALKTSLISALNKETKKLKAKKAKVTKHLDKLTNGDNLKEMADVLMANLHVIQAKATEVTLFNFYNNQEVTIRLKENISAQKNAERYYQKSKNVHVEIKHNQKLLNGITKQLADLENQRGVIETTDNYRTLQSFEKTKTKTEVAAKMNHQLPYRTYAYNDFEIWVGKSAKHNDALLKLAHKNDLWFHARGVAGSHVLLKNTEGKKVTTDVLEFTASLAARFSKNQHDTLAAVIYTSPKYVRKFKGALPGQVRVDREEVILVAPFVVQS